jgi:transcriptional regulator with XRE-family HTH domain
MTDIHKSSRGARVNRSGIHHARGVSVPALREYRLSRCLTQTELAKLAQVSTATISQIELGENTSIPTLRKLAAVLGASTDDLRFRSPTQSPAA